MTLPPDDQPPHDYQPGTGPMVGILWALTFTATTAAILTLIGVLLSTLR